MGGYNTIPAPHSTPLHHSTPPDRQTLAPPPSAREPFSVSHHSSSLHYAWLDPGFCDVQQKDVIQAFLVIRVASQSCSSRRLRRGRHITRRFWLGGGFCDVQQSVWWFFFFLLLRGEVLYKVSKVGSCLSWCARSLDENWTELNRGLAGCPRRLPGSSSSLFTYLIHLLQYYTDSTTFHDVQQYIQSSLLSTLSYLKILPTMFIS
jgi:hypothetical protein